MQAKDKAIVLHRIRYNDKDSIVTLYSAGFGKISYLAANHSRNKAVNMATLQPLSIIEYEADHKGSRELQRLKEVRPLYPFQDIPNDAVKNSISIFLAEVLYRVLNEAEGSESLFDFLAQSIELLDESMVGTANFHLVFLSKLTIFLGFYPNLEENRPHCFFDLQAGCFSPVKPAHNAWLSPEDAQRFVELMQLSFDNMHSLSFSRQERTAFLRLILDYYRIHLADFPEIKSIPVLEECFG